MFFRRIMGVFRLDSYTFESIEHDQTATGQAALVVTLVGLFLGLGSGFTTLFTSSNFWGQFFSVLIWAYIGWFLWSGISYLVGTYLFGGKADMGEMLRVIGFASAPLVLGIIPCIGGIIGVLWAASAAFVAIRQGLDFDNWRALATAAIGAVVYIIGYIIIVAAWAFLTRLFQ